MRKHWILILIAAIALVSCNSTVDDAKKKVLDLIKTSSEKIETLYTQMKSLKKRDLETLNNITRELNREAMSFDSEIEEIKKKFNLTPEQMDQVTHELKTELSNYFELNTKVIQAIQ